MASELWVSGAPATFCNLLEVVKKIGHNNESTLSASSLAPSCAFGTLVR